MAGLMKRVLVSAAVIGGLFGAVAAQAAPKEDLKGTNVVLVHGAFADGSSWNRVIPLLEARGLHVVSVQNPLARSPTMQPRRSVPSTRRRGRSYWSAIRGPAS